MHRKTNDSESCELAKKPHGFIIHADPHYQSGLRCEFFINPPPLRVLSFKGGVSRTFVYRAVLEYLEKNCILSQIEEIGGSSSGSIAAIFGCIPYENSSSRIKAIDTVADSDPWDMMKDTLGWRAYKTLTAPLNFVSSTVEWISTGIDQLTKEYSSTLMGRMVGYPFNLMSQVFKATALVTSPRSYAALYNIITAGGVYHAEKVQAAFREQIQLGVQSGLDALLEKQTNKASYMEHLQNIGLCSYIDGKLQVTPDITFNHLYELTKIPDSQFKQCYLSSARIKDKQLVVFNKDNTPNMPIHLGCRLVATFPLLFTNKSYLGDEYLDGGVINNGPVDLASDRKLSGLYEAHGVTDKLARLNIRVEYPDDYKYHLWRKRPEQNVLSKISNYAFQSILLLFTKGVDSYANDEIVTRTMQNDYPQRTLQLKDFDISQLGVELTNERRNELCNQLMPDIEEYFNNHVNEKVITNYDLSLELGKSTTMPVELQTELFKFLLDKENKTEVIFDIPGEYKELENFRNKFIHSLSKLLGIVTDQQLRSFSHTSTATIHKSIGASHDTRICITTSQNEESHHDKITIQTITECDINQSMVAATEQKGSLRTITGHVQISVAATGIKNNH